MIIVPPYEAPKRPSTQIRERAEELNKELMAEATSTSDADFAAIEAAVTAVIEYLDQLAGFPKDR